MQRIPAAGLAVYFSLEHREIAASVAESCERSSNYIVESLNLGIPDDCRVYVMTSWPVFIFHPAPWRWRVLLALSLPFWFRKAKKMWSYSAGWTLRYGGRRAVGVKPPELLRKTETALGDRIFAQNRSMNEKIEHVTCHELVHAFTAHLKLPMWLNEGLAQTTVDRVFDVETVRGDTILMLRPLGAGAPREYKNLRPGDMKELGYGFVRGYWLTRHILETQPGLMKRLLAFRMERSELECAVGEAYGMSAGDFWRRIDDLLISHYGG